MDKYFIKGELGNEYIMYGDEIAAIYVAKVMSHETAVEMIIDINGGD